MNHEECFILLNEIKTDFLNYRKKYNLPTFDLIGSGKIAEQTKAAEYGIKLYMNHNNEMYDGFRYINNEKINVQIKTCLSKKSSFNTSVYLNYDEKLKKYIFKEYDPSLLKGFIIFCSFEGDDYCLKTTEEYIIQLKDYYNICESKIKGKTFEKRTKNINVSREDLNKYDVGKKFPFKKIINDQKNIDLQSINGKIYRLGKKVNFLFEDPKQIFISKHFFEIETLLNYNNLCESFNIENYKKINDFDFVNKNDPNDLIEIKNISKNYLKKDSICVRFYDVTENIIKRIETGIDRVKFLVQFENANSNYLDETIYEIKFTHKLFDRFLQNCKKRMNNDRYSKNLGDIELKIYFSEIDNIYEVRNHSIENFF